MNQVFAVARPQSARVAGSPLTALPSFDLSRPMNRVRKEHSDWSADRLREAEEGYRKFLARSKVTSGPHQPMSDVDEVWHAHILFTKQYAADCMTYFGHYFHHEPDDANSMCDGNCGGNGGCVGGIP